LAMGTSLIVRTRKYKFLSSVTHLRSAAMAKSQAGPTTGRLPSRAAAYAGSIFPERAASFPPTSGDVHTKCVVASCSDGDSRAPIS
jgi:hypothetical protein